MKLTKYAFPGDNMDSFRQCVSPGKLVKNLTWGLVPTPCPSQDELCVLHTGDFHKRGGL